MKIVLMIDSLAPAGAQRQIANLAVGLKKLGHMPTVFYYHPFHYFKEYLEDNDVKVIFLPMPLGKWQRVLFVFKVLSRMNRLSPEVLISFLSTPSLLSRMWRLFKWDCVLITSQRSVHLSNHVHHIFSERFLSFIEDYRVVNSREMYEKLYSGRGRGKLRYIPNGIDTKWFSPIDEVNSSKGLVRFAMVSHYSREKNQHLVIKALLLMTDDERDRIEITCVGAISDKKYFDKLQSDIKKNGVGDCISFKGPCDSVPNFLKKVDWFLHSSIYEGMPNAILEAMACGLPVIASNFKSIQEIVTNGVEGVLFDNNSAESLAGTLRFILSMSNSDRDKMGLSGCRKVQNFYSLEAMATNFESLFYSEY